MDRSMSTAVIEEYAGRPGEGGKRWQGKREDEGVSMREARRLHLEPLANMRTTPRIDRGEGWSSG
jgi:hypothetical protein